MSWAFVTSEKKHDPFGGAFVLSDGLVVGRCGLAH